VTVVLLPGVNESLGGKDWPDARAMRAAGLRLALASDCNPGTSYCESMQAMWPYALHQLGLSLEETLLASTSWAAASLKLPDRGALRPGCLADHVAWEAESPWQLGYHFGVNLAREVAVGGRVVWRA
jgi:imidazolonepropionase